MKLSAQEEYGLRCLLFMARKGAGESLSIPEISRAEGLSIPNVAKLMRLLRLGGFVQSARGQAGGYTLTRPPAQVTVGSVMELLGGTFFGPHFCERHAGVERVCAHTDECAIRCLWAKINTMLQDVLGKTSLQDLLIQEQELAVRAANRRERGSEPSAIAEMADVQT
ncbi:MAG: Rrf2 family transcriptional regulator [Bryobacterales bacterium]|nr:Rrf2 family transcriptional regulator [Bryobacterales bacterium]